jgi:hypothetical protein
VSGSRHLSLVRRALLTLGFLIGLATGWAVSSYDNRRTQAARQAGHLPHHG